MHQNLKQYGRRGTTTGGLKNVNFSLDKITDKVLKQRGFIESAVVYRWTSIVGKELSEWCYPTRLSFHSNKALGATMFLDVLGARGLEVQHAQPIIIERINLIFGYAAVKNISIRQVHGIEPKKRIKKSVRSLTSEEEKWVVESVEGTKSQELKNALETLGKAILSKKLI